MKQSTEAFMKNLIDNEEPITPANNSIEKKIEEMINKKIDDKMKSVVVTPDPSPEPEENTPDPSPEPEKHVNDPEDAPDDVNSNNE